MMKNILVILAVLLVVGGVAYFRESQSDVSNESEVSGADSRPSSQAALPRLVELGAGKCMACKKMKPVIKSLEKDYAGRLAVAYIDVNEQRELANTYDWKLIPCQVFLDPQGEELWRHEGFLSREAILARWSELGYAMKDDD